MPITMEKRRLNVAELLTPEQIVGAIVWTVAQGEVTRKKPVSASIGTVAERAAVVRRSSQSGSVRLTFFWRV